MDRYSYVRELINEYGSAAWDVLDDFGIALDDWDMRQSLDTLCEDYGLDVDEVVDALSAVAEFDSDDQDDDEDWEHQSYGEREDEDGDWSLESEPPPLVQTRSGRAPAR